MESEGPVKLNVYEMRLAAMLIAAPVALVWFMCFGLILTLASSKSLFIRPEKQTNKKTHIRHVSWRYAFYPPPLYTYYSATWG